MFEKSLSIRNGLECSAICLSQHHLAGSGQPNNSISGKLSKVFRSLHLHTFTLFCLLQMLCIGHSFADDQNVLNQHVLSLEAGVQSTVDNNLFRLPDNVDPSSVGVNGHQRSDSITTKYAGLLVEQPIGLQKLHLEALKSILSYQNYGYLDGDTTTFNAYWQMALTRALTGKLSSNRSQQAAGFAYYQTYNTRDIVTTNNTDLNLDWSPLGNWHLTTDIANKSYINSQNFVQVSSFYTKFLEGGLNYMFSSGTNLSVVHDRNLGSFLSQPLDPINQVDNAFLEDTNKITLAWPVTGESLVNAQIGHIDRKYKNYPSRNYSGPIGNISYSYGAQDTLTYFGILPGSYSRTQPGGMIFLPKNIGLNVSAARSYSQYVQTSQGVNDPSSYYVNDKLTAQANWLPTSTLNLKIRFDSYRNDFRDPVYPAGTVNPSYTQRIDNGNTHTLELDWTPSKTVSLVASVIRDRRGSSIGTWDYKDRRG